MDKISVNIDLNKVDESHLYLGRGGSRRLTIHLIPVRESKYGEDYFCAQGVSKEAYHQGQKGPILGNARILAPHSQPPRQAGGGQTQPRQEPPAQDWREDIPF